MQRDPLEEVDGMNIYAGYHIMHDGLTRLACHGYGHGMSGQVGIHEIQPTCRAEVLAKLRHKQIRWRGRCA